MQKAVEYIFMAGSAGGGTGIFPANRAGRGFCRLQAIVYTPDEQAGSQQDTGKYQNRSATIKTSGHNGKKRRAGHWSISPSPAK
jgi:hypothetical protein